MVQILMICIFAIVPHRSNRRLQLPDAHCIAGDTTRLIAQIYPPTAGVEVEFFINKSSLGIARTNTRGTAILETGVTPATREIPFTAATLYAGERLQARGRWFTRSAMCMVNDHAASFN